MALACGRVACTLLLPLSPAQHTRDMTILPILSKTTDIYSIRKGQELAFLKHELTCPKYYSAPGIIVPVRSYGLTSLVSVCPHL